MAFPVLISESELRNAMRDPRYWQQGQAERKNFVSWVTKGWEALNPKTGSGKTKIWVRAYERDGHEVSAHWRSQKPPEVQFSERGNAPPNYGLRLPSPQDPVGRSGRPIEISPGSNRPATIEGRPFSGHSLDRIQGRGLPPSAVREAIRPENLVGTNNGLHIYWDRVNAVQVVVNPQTDIVVSANWRRVPPRLRRPE